MHRDASRGANKRGKRGVFHEELNLVFSRGSRGFAYVSVDGPRAGLDTFSVIHSLVTPLGLVTHSCFVLPSVRYPPSGSQIGCQLQGAPREGDEEMGKEGWRGQDALPRGDEDLCAC